MKNLFLLSAIMCLGASLAVAQTGNKDKKSNPAVAQKTAAKTAGMNSTAKTALNPQPLPPGAKATAGTDNSAKVALNPQPLPPGAKVALNPQPLPPGRTASSKAATSTKPMSGKTAQGTAAKSGSGAPR